MKCTFNGLKNEEFKEVKDNINNDAELLLGIAQSTTGHLGDIIAGIKTIEASLKLKADKLSEVFKQQKNQ